MKTQKLSFFVTIWQEAGLNQQSFDFSRIG